MVVVPCDRWKSATRATSSGVSGEVGPATAAVDVGVDEPWYDDVALQVVVRSTWRWAGAEVGQPLPGDLDPARVEYAVRRDDPSVAQQRHGVAVPSPVGEFGAIAGGAVGVIAAVQGGGLVAAGPGAPPRGSRPGHREPPGPTAAGAGTTTGATMPASNGSSSRSSASASPPPITTTSGPSRVTLVQSTPTSASTASSQTAWATGSPRRTNAATSAAPVTSTPLRAV